MLTTRIALLLPAIAAVWWAVALTCCRGFSVLIPSLLSLAGVVCLTLCER